MEIVAEAGARCTGGLLAPGNKLEFEAKRDRVSLHHFSSEQHTGKMMWHSNHFYGPLQAHMRSS